MAGVQTNELAADLVVLAGPPPIDDYRYATAILDLEGRYLAVNQAFAGLQGVDQADLPGCTEADLVARSVATALAASDRLALDAPTATLTEERVVDSVGRRRVVMCRCALLDADGRPHAVCRMYGSASARDRIAAEFRQLLDSIDPSGVRSREFEAARHGAGSASPDAGPGPRSQPIGADPAPAAADDDAVQRANAVAETEHLARQAAEVRLEEERTARAHVELALADERSRRLAAETQLADARAFVGERERHAVSRAAELEAAVAAETTLREQAAETIRTERDARQQAERAAQTEREARAQAIAAVQAELAAARDEWTSAESAAASTLAAAQAEARSLAARHHGLSAEHADTRARLEEARRALDVERTTRESLAAEVGSVGARSAAAQNAIRTQAAAVEARLASERKARSDAEDRAGRLAAELAAERAARELAETRARQLETQRAAEIKLRQHADAQAREHDARRRDEDARLAGELDARYAAEHTARQQADARALALETQCAAEQHARQDAEARTRAVEAERLAARAALEALQHRLDRAAAADAPPEPQEILRPPPTPPEPQEILRPPSTSPPLGQPASTTAAAATAESRRPTGPPRRRAATIHRPLTAFPLTTFPALSSLLGSDAERGSTKSLRAVLPAALAAIGDASAWDAVAMWHETQAGRPLTCLGIWTRHGPELDWFESISWHAKLQLGDSPAGDVDPAGQVAWVPDLGNEGRADVSPRERTARAANLACRAVVPLASGKTTVGALEVLARAARQPDDTSLARLTTAASALTPLLLRDMQDAEQRRWRT